ncbi:MAG TPA: hypothetical protein VJN50_04540 [Actinomycetota bacterium]|nr:hypothetical protein [Actinomycetota bacterium]
MGSPEKGSRRRLIALVAGLVVGAAAGAALLAPAAADREPSRFEVLHAAPALARPGRQVVLGAAMVCEPVGSSSCRIDSAVAHVWTSGRWTDVPGEPRGGGFRFAIPGKLVPAGGFSYWLQFRTGTDAAVAHPLAAAENPIRVLTTEGFTQTAIPGGFSWDAARSSDGLVLALRYGSGPGEVGLTEGGPDRELVGPSSFDVADDGALAIADWVNGRVQLFSPGGSFLRAVPIPEPRPVDLAAGRDGRLFLATLGTDGAVVEVDGSSGRVMGRYPVAGVPARVEIAGGEPRVLAGPSQWVSVRAVAGVPLPPALQAASLAPAAGGSTATALSQDLPDRRVAVTWADSTGARRGSLIRLPRGVLAGTDYFVEPMAGGGALAARGLWDDSHFGIGLFRLDAAGRVLGFSLLPEPSTRQAARYSTVRFRPPGDVLVVFEDHRGIRIERYEVR